MPLPRHGHAGLRHSIAYFNAGVRAVDIRDPFNPREAGFYIPAVTPRTDKRCVKTGGAYRRKVAIQTDNVEVDLNQTPHSVRTGRAR